MGGESLEHQKLKLQAKQLLLEKGYEEDKIILDKKWIKVDDFKFRIDAYASNGAEIAIECGNFPRWKRPYYEKYFGREHVIHLPYPPFFGRYGRKDLEEDKLTLQQQKQFLMDSYINQVYKPFKDDAVFDFQEFNETTRHLFDIDNHRTYREINPDWGDKKEAKGKTIWMNFPSSTTTSKEEYKDVIHWGMLYYGKNVLAITIIFSGRPACEKFLSMSHNTHDKIFQLLKKLPNRFHIRDGFSFWEKSSRPPLDKEWNDPIPMSELTREDYDEILENLDNLIRMQKAGLKRGPVLDLAKGFFEDYEIPEAISSMRELYELLLKPETKIDVIASNIKTLKSWDWYVSQPKEWKELHEQYIKQFEEVSIEEFKRACKKLRLDPEYEKYVKD